MNRIVLFDGECNFCNKSVQFIIKKDPKAYFSFASLQSDIGKQWINNLHIPEEEDSIVLVENGKVYTKSTAALRISKKLSSFWKVFYFFILIPKPLRDSIYQFIAKHRHKLSKQQNHCMLPDEQINKRFLS